MTSTFDSLLSIMDTWSRAELTHITLPTISGSGGDGSSIQSLCHQLLVEAERHQRPDWAAHMTAPVSVQSQAGLLLAALHHGNLLSSEIYPLLERIEKQLLDWFCQQFQQRYGHFTHGSTYANLEALWHARERSTANHHKVYGSRAVHYSIPKACQLLGLEFVSIATDNSDRMVPQALRHACEKEPPVAIIINAGTTGCGSLDPISDVLKIGKQFDCWCHIDAAWGGFLAFLPEYQGFWGEMNKADSLCFDPHKALAQPRPCSLLMYQQPLPQLNIDTSYLNKQIEQRLPGSYGGELFLPLWLDIVSNGLDVMRSKLRQRLQQAKLFTDYVKQYAAWHLHSETGIVCFKPQVANLDPLVDSAVLSTMQINQQTVYRTVFANPTTSATDLIKVMAPYW